MDMATVAAPETSALQKERNFFFYIALALFAVTVIGFLRFLALGRSSFDSPWWVHFHGVSMMGWLVLYTTQNGLVARGNLGLHRTLGILTAAWSVWVLAMGALVLGYNVATHRTPPFFTGEYVIAIDGMSALLFAGFTWAGIAMRARADWHKRLMFSGTNLIIAPGIGRLLPDALLGTHVTFPIAIGHLAFFIVAIGYDVRAGKGFHPAYAWGLGGLVAVTILPEFLVSAPPLVALVSALKG
jgi:hypothetical protein